MRVTGGHWPFSPRCSRRAECSRGRGPELWLWSFQPELGCLQVTAMSPANLSREERKEVNEPPGRAAPWWEGSGEGSTPGILVTGVPRATRPCTSHFSWGLAFSVCHSPSPRVFVKAPGLVAAGACPRWGVLLKAGAPICGPVAQTVCPGLSWQVFLSVPDLPLLWPGESYSCHFGERQSPALLTSAGVMCRSPDPSEAPALPSGAGG